MKMKNAFAYLFFVVLTACSTQESTLKVLITPDSYRVNGIDSPLATAAVDEVVRSKPEKVLISMCSNTPHAKIIQFERELRARHMSELKAAMATEGCPI
ncbi:MAG: hypothetical protein EON49_15875 [Acidovorax sp.]|nr:MAG: hypothetical protein EON49_15875 [Acidovorax sp.]